MRDSIMESCHNQGTRLAKDKTKGDIKLVENDLEATQQGFIHESGKTCEKDKAEDFEIQNKGEEVAKSKEISMKQVGLEVLQVKSEEKGHQVNANMVREQFGPSNGTYVALTRFQSVEDGLAIQVNFEENIRPNESGGVCKNYDMGQKLEGQPNVVTQPQ